MGTLRSFWIMYSCCSVFQFEIVAILIRRRWHARNADNLKSSKYIFWFMLLAFICAVKEGRRVAKRTIKRSLLTKDLMHKWTPGLCIDAMTQSMKNFSAQRFSQPLFLKNSNIEAAYTNLYCIAIIYERTFFFSPVTPKCYAVWAGVKLSVQVLPNSTNRSFNLPTRLQFIVAFK